MGIVIKNADEIARMRAAGKIVCAVLDAVEAACVPGVTTAELDRIAARELKRAKAKSAFLGYRAWGAPPYPGVLCTSINSVVVHGLPSEDAVLREGDLIGIDFACFKDGYCADAARTIAVGVISDAARTLLDTTRACLDAAIQQAIAGNRLGDLGHAIQSRAERAGFSVVRDLVGHGIGTRMHEQPDVLNYGERGEGMKLRPGLVIAIEPMVNAGGPEVRQLDDGWTIVTEDGSLSAHVEHTIAITEEGPRILTAA